MYSTGAFSSFPLQHQILFSFWNNSNWNFVLKSQTIFVVLLWSITILIDAFLRPMSIKFIVIFLTSIFVFHANLIFKFLNKFYYLRSYTRPPWQTVVLLSIHSFLRFTLQQGSKQGFLTLLDREVRVRQWKFWRKLQIKPITTLAPLGELLIFVRFWNPSPKSSLQWKVSMLHLVL